MIEFAFVVCALAIIFDSGCVTYFVQERDWRYVLSAVAVLIILFLITSVVDGMWRAVT